MRIMIILLLSLILLLLEDGNSLLLSNILELLRYVEQALIEIGNPDSKKILLKFTN